MSGNIQNLTRNVRVGELHTYRNKNQPWKNHRAVIAKRAAEAEWRLLSRLSVPINREFTPGGVHFTLQPESRRRPSLKCDSFRWICIAADIVTFPRWLISAPWTGTGTDFFARIFLDHTRAIIPIDAPQYLSRGHLGDFVPSAWCTYTHTETMRCP